MAHIHSGKSSASFVNIKKVFLNLLKEDDYFLDIGCGPGDYLVEASKIAKNLVGIDVDDESIRVSESKGFNVLHEDITRRTIFDYDSFDSILLSNVLHGLVVLDRHEKAIAEIKRILKEDGKLGIIEFFKKETAKGPPLDIRISEKELEELLKKEGFKLIKNLKVGEFNYLSIFKKNKKTVKELK